MIFADKLIDLRKKNGWSQEELAEKLNVSRQAVSKWEGAQSIPDMTRIIQLSELFGVSTDYLLKDNLEQAEAATSADLTQDSAPDVAVRTIGMEEANAFLKIKEENSRRVALGVLLCIASLIPLFVSLVFTKGESFLQVIGIAAILVLAAIGVMLIVRVSIIWGSYQILLEEGDYTRESKESNKHTSLLTTAYWCLVVAIFLLWSFLTNDWKNTWIVWPVAAVGYVAVAGIIKALERK